VNKYKELSEKRDGICLREGVLPAPKKLFWLSIKKNVDEMDFFYFVSFACKNFVELAFTMAKKIYGMSLQSYGG